MTLIFKPTKKNCKQFFQPIQKLSFFSFYVFQSILLAFRVLKAYFSLQNRERFISKLSSATWTLNKYSMSVTKWYQRRFDSKGMATKGDVNDSSTTNVCLDGGKKNQKVKKNKKGNKEVLLELIPKEALTSHPPSTIEASDDEIGKDAIDINTGEEWVTRVEVSRQAVKIFGRRMNVGDNKFKTLEDFTLEKNENIWKELKSRQHSQFEMKEAITSLECRLMEVLNTKETITLLECQLTEALGTIETRKAHVKALKKGVGVGGSASPNCDRGA